MKKLLNWTTHKLRLHVPFWVCGALLLCLFLLPESIGDVLVFPLAAAFFVSRFLWRKWLKKKGWLKNESSGVTSLVFWGFIGIFLVYLKITPPSPELVMYQTNEPDVLSEFDRYEPPVTDTESDDDTNISLKNPAKKGLLSTVTEAAIQGIKTDRLVCDVLLKQEKLDVCSSSTIITKRPELDGNLDTIEIVVSDKEPEICEKSECHITLIHTTVAELLRYSDALTANKKSNKPPPTAKATIIAEWRNVVTPLVVSNMTSNGWRQLHIKTNDGKRLLWEYSH